MLVVAVLILGSGSGLFAKDSVSCWFMTVEILEFVESEVEEILSLFVYQFSNSSSGKIRSLLLLASDTSLPWQFYREKHISNHVLQLF